MVGRHGRGGTGILCSFLSRDGLFGKAIIPRSHSLVGIPFIAKSTSLSTGFIGRTGRTKFRGLGKREAMNKVHTDVCGTVPCRNIITLMSFVGGFRRRGLWSIWVSLPRSGFYH